MFSKAGKATVVIDGQWGSTGKGKLADWIVFNDPHDLHICDFGPNAGHTAKNGKDSWVTRQVPMAVADPNARILIGPGSVIDVAVLQGEIKQFGLEGRLVIHPHAAIVTEEGVKWEQQNIGNLGSTSKGTGYAQASRLMRQAKLAGDIPSLEPHIGDTTEEVNRCLTGGGKVMVESSQGFDLSLTHGHQYPYVTARDVTTCAIMNRVGIGPDHLGSVIGSLRTYPIRVASPERGWSGPCYSDQLEFDWEKIAQMSSAPEGTDLSERTTVTKKIRRVFGFSFKQLDKFVSMNHPSHLFINFINHVHYEDLGKLTFDTLTERSSTWIKSFEMYLQQYRSMVKIPKVALIGTGPDRSEMITR